MNISKIKWTIRALGYKIMGLHIEMPSYIGKPVYISNKKAVKVKRRCRIYPGIRIETKDANSSLIIDENSSIGQNCHIVAFDQLEIGKNVTISGNVFISDCAHEYKELSKSVLEQPVSVKKTKIGDECFIGYGAVIQAGTILGKHCVVGSNAVVKGIFGDYEVIVGVPARVVKKYNKKKECWESV